MLARIEIGELVDSVEHIAHEFFQEQTRNDPDAAAEPAGHRLGQLRDVSVVNNGSNTSDGQHQGSQSKETGPIPLTPTKNGFLTVPSLSVTAPTADQFLSQQSCPNPNWTPTLGSAITLSSFDYTLTFAGFSGPYIEFTGP